MEKRIYIISLILPLMLVGCAPHYIIPKSNSYSTKEFAQLGGNYNKFLYTKSGKRIHFNELNIKSDTVYLHAEDPSVSTSSVPFSDVKMISLSSKISSPFWGTFAGVGVGIGISALLNSGGTNNFGSAITYAILPSVIGFGGAMIGHGIDNKNAYKGYYRITPDGGNYRIQPMK
ncbi:MAG TPA: hypothetical protein VKA08_02145 [Balneolales bacterium]|nr:hypothetical protein [Balneolales bacterium]